MCLAVADKNIYFSAYNPENEKESFPDCSNRMRMKIIVHPQHPVHPIPPLKTTTTTTKKITTTSSKFRSKSTETTTTTIRTTTQNDLGRDQGSLLSAIFNYCKI